MQEGVCLLCSVLSCVPGFYSSGCAVGSVHDAACLPCEDGPSHGRFDWVSGCDYTCAAGYYYQNASVCAPCSVLHCEPGYFASKCTPTNNSACWQCDPPMSDLLAFNWTAGCDWVCNAGYYYLPEEGVCAPCSVPFCFAGFYATECTMYGGDSFCAACAQPSGAFVWAGGCEFVCQAGSYLIEGGCASCTASRNCAAGSYFVACNQTADSRCVGCPPPPTIGYVWTVGCEYECVPGAYWLLDGTTCVPCTVDRVCPPGSNLVACTPLSDSVCQACPHTPTGSFNWTGVGCGFVCSGGFYRSQAGNCVQCSSHLECAPGTFAVGCSATADASCTACVPPSSVGSFYWTEGVCEYMCSDGFYMQNGLCVECSVALVCPGGFESSDCTLSGDSTCVACPSPGVPGSFAWLEEGCNFYCNSGYYSNGSACVRCGQNPCAPGTYAMGCTAYADSFCVSCFAPAGGPFEWVEGCEFRCSEGYYLDGGVVCVGCSSSLRCGPGMYESACTATEDSACVSCTSHCNVGTFEWTNGCLFQCVGGYFLNGSCCVRCTDSACGAGMYRTACTASVDGVCASCVTSMTTGFVWTTGCNFECLDGFYLGQSLGGSYCRPCSQPNGSIPSCDAGFYGVACTRTADAQCVPCPSVGEGVVWQDGCLFGCAVGFFFSTTPNRCVPCSTPACAAGSYASMCAPTSDSVCVDCVPPAGDSSFTWVQGCEFECDSGYVVYNGSCVLASTPVPRIILVVKTAVTMNNTVGEVCSNLPALLQSISAALSLASSGGLAFTTNVTSLNGEVCVRDVCPQCAGVDLGALLSAGFSNSSGQRRLLQTAGVTVATSSNSVKAVTPGTVSTQSPSSSVLVSSIASATSLTVSGVVAQTTVLTVIQPAGESASVSSTSGWNSLQLVCLVALCVLVAVCVWFAVVCFCYCRDRGTSKERKDPGGESGLATEYVVDNMPRISLLNRRSRSRERRSSRLDLRM